jgi:hypothetical protein
MFTKDILAGFVVMGLSLTLASKWSRAHFWRSPNVTAGGESQSIGRGDLRSNGLESAYFLQLRLTQTIFIRNLRDFADDPEDFGPCVDPVELLSH